MSKMFKAFVAPTVLSIVGLTAGISPAMAAGGIRAAYVEEVIIEPSICLLCLNP